MKNKINLCLNLLLTTAFLLLFTDCKEKGNEEITFPVEVGERPESITKGFKGNYFVTVMNAKETGDGGVNEITSDGVKTFFRGADEPKGMIYLKEHLYFTDVNRIWKVNQEGQGEVFVDQAGFPEKVLYFNDVCIDEKGTGMYVVDMEDRVNMWNKNKDFTPLDSPEALQKPNVGRIYHIDLNGKVTIAQDTSNLMPNPNGVGIDKEGNLMIAAFFKGKVLIAKNGVLTPLKGIFRGADGVAQDSKGNYYVSSWKLGTVWKIDGSSQESAVLIEGLESAADFLLEEEKGRILLPDMLAGKVLEVDINEK